MDKYFEIKVSIKRSSPSTWRILKIPANITFNQLAAIIEIAFGWSGSATYEFEAGVDEESLGQFIGIPEENENDIENIKGEILDSKKTPIYNFLKNYSRIKFTYNPAASWEHDIVVEKEVNEKIEYPFCIKAEGGNYPEDCGGVWGYTENYPKDNGRKKVDMEAINVRLKEYKKIA